MEIVNNFRLGCSPSEAFALLVDLDRVVPCLPGAELGAELPEGSRSLTVRVKLGPMRFVYAGSVRIVESDAGSWRAVLAGQAVESHGQGDASAVITMHVSEARDGTAEVSSVAQVELTGRAAQMGHGVVQAVAKELMSQMVASIEQVLREPVSPGYMAGMNSGSNVESPRTMSAGRVLTAAIVAFLRSVGRRAWGRRRSV